MATWTWIGLIVVAFGVGVIFAPTVDWVFKWMEWPFERFNKWMDKRERQFEQRILKKRKKGP